MLRITVRDGPKSSRDQVCLFLEGRIIGPWVSELESVWQATRKRFRGSSSIQINLSSVSYISQPGTALLCKMDAEGAELIASTPLASIFLDEIRRYGTRKLWDSKVPRPRDGVKSHGNAMKRKHDSGANHGKQHDLHEQAAPSHAEISERAYEIWMESGREDGKHEEHWRKAENEVRSKPKKGILR